MLCALRPFGIVRADRSGLRAVAEAGPVLARFVRIAGPPAGRTIRALRAAPSSRFPPASAPSPRHAFHRARSFASALRMIHLFSLFRRLSGMASAMPSVRRLRRTARRFAARAAPSTTPKRKDTPERHHAVAPTISSATRRSFDKRGTLFLPRRRSHARNVPGGTRVMRNGSSVVRRLAS